MKNFISILGLLLVSTFFTLAPVNAQESIFDVSSSSLFSNDDEFLKVDEAFAFNFHQQENKLQVSFDIAEGYYLYRHQFKFTANNAQYSPVALPNGKEHEDEFFGVQQIFTDKLTFDINIEETAQNPTITVKYQGCAEKGLCYPPTSKTIELSQVKSNTAGHVLAALSNEETSDSYSASNSNNSEQKAKTEVSEQNKLAAMLQQDSLLLTLIAFFVGGLLLSFTPCVFPMYPILTGIIVGQGDNLSTKRAFSLSFFYVQGMAVTYTILGVVVALAGAQFQAMFQHPVVLIALSVLFIFLALSMFGMFNLALPSSWQNKLNNMSNNQEGGSYTGVLSMGAISGLVASPCTTAPLTGALIYISQTGDIALGASALYALSLGMGLPLLVLGSSGGKILPKAGNWMNIIKNIFGILLLAVPIFLVERFIPAQASAALWALLLMSAATYFYVANLDSQKNFWYGLRSLIVFSMFFVGASNLYSLFFTPTSTEVAATASQSHEKAFVHISNLTELDALVVKANNEGQTVMVDLYADWCIACKEFEEYTFPKPEVQSALANTVLVQIDMTDMGTDSSLEIMEKYDVFGLPSILFFDLKGEELSNNRVTGFMEAAPFAEHINRIFN